MVLTPNNSMQRTALRAAADAERWAARDGSAMESDLLTLSEIAVALGGFASIVVLFRRSPDGHWDRATAYGFRDMISVALGAASWAALPFVVVQFTEGTENWRILCGAFGAAQLLATVSIVVSRVGKLGPKPVSYLAAASLSGHFLIGSVNFRV